ncbi:MAG: hypothetical protein HUJ56_06225, partial [Erysipelotrichaceae bacterium]|nr:hypothetical protein [Erysipelotrichaceae bacterium]
GCEDDPSDVLDFLLTKPHEMAMVYEGTSIGDGHESIEIIEEVEELLKINHLPLPDEQKVAFSSFSELHGWGENFNGRSLSVILFANQEEKKDEF